MNKRRNALKSVRVAAFHGNDHPGPYEKQGGDCYTGSRCNRWEQVFGRAENERVRVLRYHDKPEDKTLQHAHPDYVMYAESSFKRRLTFPGGRKQEVDVKAGSIVWMKAHQHIGENIGDTDTDVILVELKENGA